MIIIFTIYMFFYFKIKKHLAFLEARA